MTAVVVTSALAPLMKEPNPRAEMVSQMLTGETGTVIEDRAAWLQVRRDFDGYAGWINRGYLRAVPPAEGMAWSARSGFRAEKTELETSPGVRITLPLLARLARINDGWELASGQRGRLVAGSIHPADEFSRSARTMRTIDWVRARFTGVPYLWGGITPWGVDCSGLVQTAFAARGQVLPRDSHDQANQGIPVATDAVEPGDLLFFTESGARITHVAFAGDDDTLVHSTLSCGGFIVESWKPGTRAARLRDQLAAIRRIGDPQSVKSAS